MYSQLQEGAVDAADQQVAVTETPPADDTAPVAVRRPTSLDLLKAEIARAMQVAADRERERIDAGVGEDESAQVEKIFARAAAEAAELSKHADEDVNVVNAWYKDEIKRIRAEADRQIEERRTRLEQSLTHHGSLIDAEVESVHVAVQTYRGSLGAFFGRMAAEHDPSAIARLAGDLPDPPDLDEVRAEARSNAMQALQQRTTDEPAEPMVESSANGNGRSAPAREPVAVMDPDANEQGDDPLTGTAVVAAAPPASVPSADEPSSPEPEAVAVAVSSEVEPSHENVVDRVIRTITSWSSPTGAPQDK
jgi:hypothetical protein